MSDNVVSNAATTAGTTFATDDIGGVHYPRTKITIGADGVNGGDVSSANPLPVSGTVDLGAIDNAVLDDIAASVDAIETAVEGTLTVGLPTGAATAAKQPALGTAGTASADVISVQGIASMTPLLVNGSGVTQPVSGTVTANAGTDLNTSLLALESGGNLATVVTRLTALTSAVSGSEVQVDVVAALPAGTNNIGDVDVASIAAGDNNIGNVDIVTVPADPFGANADAASATGSISAKLRFIASTGIPITGTVTVGSHAVTNAGTFPTQPGAAASGGTTPYTVLSTTAVVAATVKASPGQVYGVHAYNDGANEVFLRLYNSTTVPATSDTPVYRAMIPGNAAGAGFIFNSPVGMEFTSGIGIRVTGAVADNDATVLAANEVMANVMYK